MRIEELEIETESCRKYRFKVRLIGVEYDDKRRNDSAEDENKASAERAEG